MSSDKNNEADFLMQLAEANGVAVSTVSDGHLLIFKRARLQKMLDDYPNNDKFVILVKRAEFKN